MNILSIAFVFSSSPVIIPIIAAAAGIFFIMVMGWKLVERISTKPAAHQSSEYLKMQAEKRAGTMNKDHSGLAPGFSFRHDAAEITVAIAEGGRGTPRLTYAAFQTAFFPDWNFRISSHHFKALISFSRIKNIPGKLIHEFDFEGNDAAFINQFLTPEIQRNLLEYRQAVEIRFGERVGVGPALKAHPGRLYVSTDGFKTEAGDYDRLIGSAIMLYEQLKTMSSAENISGSRFD